MDFLLLSLRTELANLIWDLVWDRSYFKASALWLSMTIMAAVPGRFHDNWMIIARDIAAAAPFFPSAGADPFSWCRSWHRPGFEIHDKLDLLDFCAIETNFSCDDDKFSSVKGVLLRLLLEQLSEMWTIDRVLQSFSNYNANAATLHVWWSYCTKMRTSRSEKVANTLLSNRGF